ncbi:MAG: TadE/TadG family type IV pilus assembly protein [Nitriliruptorales bacterium]
MRLRGSSEQGAAAVEFAIVAGLLLVLLVGTVQFGIAWNRRQGLEAAAREGARLASVGADFDAISARVRDAQSLFDSVDVQVRTDPATSVPCSGGARSVTVTAQVPASPRYAITIPLWGSVEVTYSAQGIFNCE